MDFLEDSEGVRAGLLGGLLVYHHYADVTPATVRVLVRARRKAVITTPRLGMLIVADASGSPPNAEARTLLVELIRSNEANVTAMAYVMRGRGFGAAAVRGAIAGLTLAARTRYPLKVFSTVSEATMWLASKGAIPSTEVTAVAREVDAVVDAPRTV